MAKELMLRIKPDIDEKHINNVLDKTTKTFSKKLGIEVEKVYKQFQGSRVTSTFYKYKETKEAQTTPTLFKTIESRNNNYYRDLTRFLKYDIKDLKSGFNGLEKTKDLIQDIRVGRLKSGLKDFKQDFREIQKTRKDLTNIMDREMKRASDSISMAGDITMMKLTSLGDMAFQVLVNAFGKARANRNELLDVYEKQENRFQNIETIRNRLGGNNFDSTLIYETLNKSGVNSTAFIQRFMDLYTKNPNELAQGEIDLSLLKNMYGEDYMGALKYLIKDIQSGRINKKDLNKLKKVLVSSGFNSQTVEHLFGSTTLAETENIMLEELNKMGIKNQREYNEKFDIQRGGMKVARAERDRALIRQNLQEQNIVSSSSGIQIRTSALTTEIDKSLDNLKNAIDNKDFHLSVDKVTKGFNELYNSGISMFINAFRNPRGNVDITTNRIINKRG